MSGYHNRRYQILTMAQLTFLEPLTRVHLARRFARPDAETFAIPPIAALLNRWLL